jgi:ACR3 family arsenite efflux pump ArsB
MKPMAVLVVSVLDLAFGTFCTLAFVFLPSVLDAPNYWERLVFSCLVLLLLWLSVGIIQRKRLARYMGAVVYAPLALSGLLAIPFPRAA